MHSTPLGETGAQLLGLAAGRRLASCSWVRGPPGCNDGELRSHLLRQAQFRSQFGFLGHAVIPDRRRVTTQHIILSCTNRKRSSKDAPVRLRDIPAGTVADRAAAWIDAVSHQPARYRVRDLYAGEYWHAAIELAHAAASRGETRVSVMSAGLGLVDSDDEVPTYAATFTAGHADSVCGRGEPTATRREWWSEITNWARSGSARRLGELAETPGAHLLVCAGPDYLDAVADDLRAAHKVLGNGRLVIVGSQLPLEGLAEVWVRCPGQLRMRVGGSMASTGVRTARVLVEAVQRGVLDAERGNEIVASLLSEAPPLPSFERARMSDAEVREWIVGDKAAHPGSMNKSASLRRLRQQDRACEQARFGRLYDLTKTKKR